MMNLFRSWLKEPRVENAPRRVWRDWVLVTGLLIGLAVELVVRTDINARPVAVPFVAILGMSLLVRRTYPLKVFLFGFGGVIIFDVVSVLAGFGQLNVYSSALLLFMMYPLFRWGSGKDMAIGSVIGVVLFVLSSVLDYGGVSDLIGGFLVLEFPAALGLAVRYLQKSQQQAREEVRQAERETLARELHDTVAHHVSAIAIQAQAGQFVAESGSLDGAKDALAVIEEEAARTLAEMRSIVGVLRDAATPAELAPQRSILDLKTLASTTGLPTVDVQIDGDANAVGQAVGSAVYRIGQEAITNARRHAKNVSKITVDIQVESGSHIERSSSGGTVHLRVSDDGSSVSTPWDDGFGLIGMKERAELLGGSLEAGPAGSAGWTVQASLPYEESL